MIPLKDNIPPRTTPVVNYAMIGLTAVAFFLQFTGERGALIEKYGMIPKRVLNPDAEITMPVMQRVVDPRTGQVGQIQRGERRVAEPPIPVWLTLLTSVFLHGGWLHFLGNMWFLHIFGDNVEDRFGHVGFVVFYLVCGMLAGLAHLASAPDSTVPTIGASGAIAGVMGAYLLLYPRAMVLTLVPIFFFLQMVVLPAPIFLGIWFLIQFFQGAASVTTTQTAGVAWWAHIGGFVVGMAAVWILGRWGRLRPPVTTARPHTDHVSSYRIGPGRGRPWD